MQDPRDAASNATLASRYYYGEARFDAWHCVLQKGVGKVAFDPAQHGADDRRTAVSISVIPLPEQNVSFAIERDMIAESREWINIVWASLKALGLSSLREAPRWVKVQQVPTGRRYTNARGEEKEATTIRFLAIYPSEQACRAAYLAELGKDTLASTIPTPGAQSTALKIAMPFIKAFAKKERYDLERTRNACRAQSVITDAIDVESPAFAQIVAEALAEHGS